MARSPADVVGTHLAHGGLGPGHGPGRGGASFACLGIDRDEIGAIVLQCEDELDLTVPNALVEVLESPEELIEVLAIVASHRGG